LELEGTLHRGEVTVTDLFDEVLKLAWERFADRPRQMRLDLWLIDLLHDVFEQLIKQEPRPHVSLEEKVQEPPPAEAPQVDDQEWWNWLLGNDETFLLEDFIPDLQEADVWDNLAAEEQRNRLLSLISELPTEQRQAFLLHALEDYGPVEIAMLQDRSENEVRRDIEAAKQALKERIQANAKREEASHAHAAT
jgi:RNA polymerase sigma factor (sigma-70 family)